MTKFIFHSDVIFHHHPLKPPANPHHVHLYYIRHVLIHISPTSSAFIIFAVALSLHLQKIVIPQYKFRGESATLECDYELNGQHEDSFDDDNEGRNYNYFHHTPADVETLYSVKWYKDNEEFYRYRPKSNPPRNIYKGEEL